MVESIMQNIENPEKYYLGFEHMFVRILSEKDGKYKFEELPPFMGENGEEPMTLKDVSDKYKDEAISILLYCETYRSGAVFRYNNYNTGEWLRIGKLAGFA